MVGIPKPPNDGVIGLRGPPGTAPTQRLVTLLDDSRLQIAPQEAASLAKKIIFDPRAAIVECVSDEVAAPTLGKSPAGVVHVRDTCLRVLFNKAAAADPTASGLWPKGLDEIALKARTHAERTEWIRFFVDLGALAAGEASTSLTQQHRDDDHHHGGSGQRTPRSGRLGGSLHLDVSRGRGDDDDDDGGSSAGDSDSVAAYSESGRGSTAGGQHNNSGFLGVSESAATASQQAPVSLRPPPPHTLVVPDIKIEPPPPNDKDAHLALQLSHSSGAFVQQQQPTPPSVSLSSSSSSSPHPTPQQAAMMTQQQYSQQQQQNQQQQQQKQNRTRWAPVTHRSNPIYRCLRASNGVTSPNSELWERHIHEIQQEVLPAVEWSVDEPPALETMAARAAVEALHSCKTLLEDPSVFGAAWGAVDKAALEQVGLSSVDVAYDMISKARHSCDDPSIRPVKCAAVLCALGDVDPERQRYERPDITKPSFVRFAGMSYFEVSKNKQPHQNQPYTQQQQQQQQVGISRIRVNGRGFEYSCDGAEIASVSPSGMAGVMERIVVREFRRWMPANDVESLFGTEKPSPIVITIRPRGSPEGCDMHLVLLFKWPVRADNAARALSDFWVSPFGQSSSSGHNALAVAQRGTKVAAGGGGLSFFSMMSGGDDAEEVARRRMRDVSSKWMMLDFIKTRNLINERGK